MGAVVAADGLVVLVVVAGAVDVVVAAAAAVLGGVAVVVAVVDAGAWLVAVVVEPIGVGWLTLVDFFGSTTSAPMMPTTKRSTDSSASTPNRGLLTSAS